MARELWALDLEREPVPLVRWLELLPLLSPSRGERAVRLRDPLKKRQVIAAEALLRVALVERIGPEARILALQEDGFGKPLFADRPDIGFNLSHSGRYICLALGDEPVGVDVEAVRDVDVEAFSPWLTEEERAWLARSTDPGERLRRLFAVWTLKESVTKAMGRGHGITFASFSALADDAAVPSVAPRLASVVLGWHVTNGSLPGGYALAAATRSPGKWPAPRMVGEERLVSFLGAGA